MSDEELKAELERLRNENAARILRYPLEGQRKGSSLRLRHGALSRDFVQEQWLKLLDMSDDIRAFIAASGHSAAD
jgi:hypothetical protein